MTPKRTSRLRLFRLFVSLPVSALLIGFAFSQDHARRVEAHKTALQQAIGSLTAAASMYAQEHGNHLPPAANWEQALQPNSGPIPLTLPRMPGGAGRRIALNRAFADRDQKSLAHPAQAILFFESTATNANAIDELTSLVPAGDPSPLLFGFADGHIEEFSPARREDVLVKSHKAEELNHEEHGEKRGN